MSASDDTGETAKVREAKAAARTAIGKLIGDDAEVRAGTKEQEAAAKAAADTKTSKD
jgi:hypothetical protein